MKYLKEKTKNVALGGSLFLILIAVWFCLSVFKIIPVWLLPDPREVVAVFRDLFQQGAIFRMLGVSFLNIFPAFFIAILTALVLGISIGMNKNFSKFFSPFLSAAYLVPSLAWLPLVILFFGFSRQSIWAMIFLSSFIRMIYNVIGGVKGVNANWLLAARNFELGKVETAVKVILPGALPQILSGMRIGFGSAWRSLIGAEMLVVSAGGLGKYIWMSQWAFKMEQVIAGIIVIALIGFLAEKTVFGRIEKMTLEKWGMVQ